MLLKGPAIISTAAYACSLTKRTSVLPVHLPTDATFISRQFIFTVGLRLSSYFFWPEDYHGYLVTQIWGFSRLQSF